MKRALKLLCLLVALALCVSGINAVLMPKKNLANLSIRVLPQLPHDTVDVCVLGSSHLFLSVNPAQMWRETGISTYLLCSSAQNYLTAYHFLIDLLKTQTPKVVILDLFSATLDQCSPENYRYSFFMPLSLNKLELWDEYTRDMPERFELLLQLPWYHARVEDVTVVDYQQQDLNNMILAATLGYLFTDLDNESTADYQNGAQTSEIKPLKPAVKGWLDRILDLCREKGIRVIGLEVPYMARSANAQRMMNGAIAELRQRGEVTLNFFDTVDRADWPPRTDYTDNHHTNYRGAEAITAWLTQYMADNCDLPDHRGDSRYERWDRAAAQYERMKLDAELARMGSLDAILKAMQPDQTLSVFLPQSADTKSELYRQAVAATGLPSAPARPCTLVFKGGRYAYTLAPWDNATVIELNQRRYAIRGNDVTLDGKTILPEAKGMRMVLFDEMLQTPPTELTLQ